MALCSFGKSREVSPFSARISPYETNSGSIEAVLTLRIITLLTPSHITRISSMVTGKRLADIGYRAFSGSMMLLTVYGGYLCAMRGYRYMQKQKQLKLAAENQDPDAIKE